VRLNLILCFIWLLIAVPLLLANLTPLQIPDVPVGREGLLVGGLAALLALYNLARWYASRSRRTPPPPATTKRRLDAPRLEYNPQFDFNRPGPKTLKIDEDE